MAAITVVRAVVQVLATQLVPAVVTADATEVARTFVRQVVSQRQVVKPPPIIVEDIAKVYVTVDVALCAMAHVTIHVQETAVAVAARRLTRDANFTRMFQ